MQRPVGERVRTVAIDPRGHLHHGVVGEVRDGAVVANVDDLDVAGAGMQRRDERGGGVAVEGASSLLQQLRLGVERGSL